MLLLITKRPIATMGIHFQGRIFIHILLDNEHVGSAIALHNKDT